MSSIKMPVDKVRHLAFTARVRITRAQGARWRNLLVGAYNLREKWRRVLWFLKPWDESASTEYLHLRGLYKEDIAADMLERVEKIYSATLQPDIEPVMTLSVTDHYLLTANWQ